MSELVTKSVPQEQQEQRIETRIAVKRIGGFSAAPTPGGSCLYGNLGRFLHRPGRSVQCGKAGGISARKCHCSAGQYVPFPLGEIQ